jgi:hypothetical protein
MFEKRSFRNKLSHAWNAFRGKDTRPQDLGSSYHYRPDRARLSYGNEKSIVSSIYNQIAIDVSAMNIRHIRKDQNGNFKETIDSALNEVLNIEANIDQTGRALVLDIVISMFDEGAVAIVPIETSIDPNVSNSYDIHSLRTGQILEWFPKHVRVRLYNESTGEHEELILAKNTIAIVENPLFAVMNEPNSTLKRLVRKLNLLDSIDEQSASGKLDLIIKLPYLVKSVARKEQAEKRRLELENQLAGSKYGIAYLDGTENITQLNRPVENNLMSQITFLTSMLHSQLGLTQSIFDGTADEKTMLNYYNRTIEPILSAITEEMHRKFLTKTARTQNQAITYFRPMFKLVPVAQLAEVADKFSRNAILSANEMRSVVGYKPVDQPDANELRNKNMPIPKDYKPNTINEEEDDEE